MKNSKTQGLKSQANQVKHPLCTFLVKKTVNSKDKEADDSLEIDPELRYSFQRNFQFLQRVFSIDTVVKPLPPTMAYNVSRNLTFFTSIFTQFFDPEGIANAQKSLGLGQEEKVRKVR
ncbi:hypothetical protein RDI58_015802 [Solanum bulbocastanum]|uniref:Uncharacterized protein n=1 Tax=Solanum bulbocastanum TaxID=147425 RepID=A0AAN8TL62_SOLBU